MLLLGGVPEERLRALRASAPEVAFVPVSSANEQLSEIVDADATYGWPSREALSLAQRLRWVHVGGAGIEHIRTLPELIESDVVLTNGRGTMARSVADHAFALILSFTRRLREIAEDQRAHRWTRDLRLAQMRELTGSTLGILGLGQIGSYVAQRGAGFEMRVMAVDARPPAHHPYVGDVWGLDRLDELLASADYVVVTIPFTPESRRLLDRRRLQLMQHGAYLVVVSRGGIVDEGALLEALRSGQLAGAGLDVAETEPIPPESPLWDLPNLILTPHCSGNSPQTHDRLWALFAENVRRFVAGETLLNRCDKRAGY